MGAGMWPHGAWPAQGATWIDRIQPPCKTWNQPLGAGAPLQNPLTTCHVGICSSLYCSVALSKNAGMICVSVEELMTYGQLGRGELLGIKSMSLYYNL